MCSNFVVVFVSPKLTSHPLTAYKVFVVIIAGCLAATVTTAGDGDGDSFFFLFYPFVFRCFIFRDLTRSI